MTCRPGGLFPDNFEAAECTQLRMASSASNLAADTMQTGFAVAGVVMVVGVAIVQFVVPRPKEYAADDSFLEDYFPSADQRDE